MNIHAVNGIRTRDPSNQAHADLWLDRMAIVMIHITQLLYCIPNIIELSWTNIDLKQ